MNAKPFIKWAGGKSQLLPDIRKKYPKELGKSITKYCEPFVGGGAVLFDVLSNYEIKEVLINDINAELTNTYSHIKNHLAELLLELDKMQEHFWPLDAEARKEYYYEKREWFNYLKVNGDEAVNLEKAALFIFLNKTCFNGLFRVNKKGLFNVPMGAYKKPMICDKDNLTAISGLLKSVTIKQGDYKECLGFIDENTFVYIDPPYRPLTETASFTSYAEADFNDKEQRELGVFVDSITGKKAKVVISNSDPKNSDEADTFFDDLYGQYEILRVTAKRMINCNGESRGNVSELLISNFKENESEETSFEKYKGMVEKYIKNNDTREINFQNEVVKKLFENLFTKYDVVCVDTKYGDSKNHNYYQYSGKYEDSKGNNKPATPDLLIVKNWNWYNVSNKINYVASVEVKSPYGKDAVYKYSDELPMQIQRHLNAEQINKVIFTDTLEWRFYSGNDEEKNDRITFVNKIKVGRGYKFEWKSECETKMIFEKLLAKLEAFLG